MIVQWLCTSFLRRESAFRRHSRGRLRVTSAVDDHYFQLTARRHRTTTTPIHLISSLVAVPRRLIFRSSMLKGRLSRRR
ncbi:hypothetical protein AVEN_226771-1, partial [Araneus ventricosus]